MKLIKELPKAKFLNILTYVDKSCFFVRLFSFLLGVSFCVFNPVIHNTFSVTEYKLISRSKIVISSVSILIRYAKKSTVHHPLV